MSADASRFQLSPDEKCTLSRVLDEIIPPSRDGRLPGAGELGGVAYVEQILEQSPELGPVIVEGLSALEDLAGSRGPGGYAALSQPDGLELLKELATTQPVFLSGLLFHIYAGYYLNARVVEALGLEARPPHPKGYDMEANDLTLLDEVRQRRKLYRAC